MNETEMTLGRDWEGQPVIGWFASEKLQGVRAYWDGQRFWTRGGHIIPAPAWFPAGMPNAALDGEIWQGYGTERVAVGVVQSGRFIPGHTRFAVFDCPAASGIWAERMDQARRLMANCQNAFCVKTLRVESGRQMAEMAAAILHRGGEGLMLRNPAVTRYERGRTANLLKLKSVPYELLFN